ncbi:MAG: hypothetical protein ACRC2J_16630 [Microcoleaceae cyanobacterium]
MWILVYYVLLLTVTLVGFILGVDSHFYEENGFSISLENFLFISLIAGLFGVFISKIKHQSQSLIIGISIFLAIYIFVIKSFSRQQVYKLLLSWYSSTLLLIAIALFLLIFTQKIPWFSVIFIPIPIFLAVKMLKIIFSGQSLINNQ